MASRKDKTPKNVSIENTFKVMGNFDCTQIDGEIWIGCVQSQKNEETKDPGVTRACSIKKCVLTLIYNLYINGVQSFFTLL